jgi:hypothetical protein
MGIKQRRQTAAALAAVPENESRVILATGSYIGEGFDDARLDTPFLAADFLEGHAAAVCGPVASSPRREAICAGLRLCGDSYVLMLARMYERRLRAMPRLLM